MIKNIFARLFGQTTEHHYYRKEVVFSIKDDSVTIFDKHKLNSGQEYIYAPDVKQHMKNIFSRIKNSDKNSKITLHTMGPIVYVVIYEDIGGFSEYVSAKGTFGYELSSDKMNAIWRNTS